AKTDSTEQIIAKTGHLFTTAIQDSIALLDAATIDLLAEKMISAKRIVLFGVGASAIVASDIFHKLIRVNKNTLFSADLHA
ncbi:MurR/RpiR family transcriptional regulator, partial [Enterobacter cloacae]